MTEHTKGKLGTLKISFGKYGAFWLCWEDDPEQTNISETASSDCLVNFFTEIVRRWNSHDALLEACKAMTAQCEAFNWNQSLPQTKGIDEQIIKALQAIEQAESEGE